MSKYPEEIVKTAETLVEEHYFAVWPADSKGDFALYRGSKCEEYIEATRSAIVSCKFAYRYMNTEWQTPFLLEEVRDIQKYLEELL